MPYAYIIAALALFSAGYGLSHQLDRAEIQELHSSIDRGNVMAQNLLDASIAQSEKHRLEQQAINQQMEATHDQSIRTINAYHDQLAAVRLYDPGKPHRCDAASANSDSGPNQGDEAGADGLSREATDFLRGEARDASIAAAERNYLLDFINNQNCGIHR